jgi:hypothetical protein
MIAISYRYPYDCSPHLVAMIELDWELVAALLLEIYRVVCR